MEQIRRRQWRCNKFLASPWEPRTGRRGRVFLVGSVGIALTILGSTAACSPRPVDRVRKIQSLPHEAATFKKMRRYLSDSDASVRAAAVAALDARSEPAAVQSILAAMGDRSALVRSMAARRLGEIADPEGVARLLEHLEGDADWSVRQRCAEALGALGPAGAEVGLAKAATDPEPTVRLAAVGALSRSFAPLAIESLSRSVVEDPDWEIRVEAASGLARASAGEAIPPLERALQDPNEFVRSAAASGVAALHKQGLQAPPPPEPPPGALPKGESSAGRGSGV